MNKKEIIDLLRSMDSSRVVDLLVNKINSLSDKQIESILSKIGNNEEAVRNKLQQIIEDAKNQVQNHTHEEHIPINKMFAYGIDKKTVHLHMPIDLHQMISEIGPARTVNTVNLFLLDAIERIRKAKNNGDPRFKDIDNIYMISPILVGSEMKFLSELDFTTHSYNKKELQDSEFVLQNPEAQLAVLKFGTDKNIGTAKISMDIINSSEWQQKRRLRVIEFQKKGIVLDESDNCLE